LSKFTENRLRANLLPGTISHGISILGKLRPPFTFKEKIRVGYFGGLSREKGVGFLLDLMPLTARHVTFVVTGSGELANELRLFKDRFPEKLEFLESVNDEELQNAMGSVDLIVNAHQINNGVFPFKVLESIASGRLLVSTYVNIDSFDWLNNAIEFRELTLEDFVNAIHQSHEIYKIKSSAIANAAMIAEQLYSHEAIKAKIMNFKNRDLE
jgi:glycosyltransferase involved in cell wall biosynthesis